MSSSQLHELWYLHRALVVDVLASDGRVSNRYRCRPKVNGGDVAGGGPESSIGAIDDITLAQWLPGVWMSHVNFYDGSSMDELV